MHAVTRRRDWDHEDAAVRGAWHASIGAMTEDDIRARSSCAPGVAFRIAGLRRAGGLRPLAWWLDGDLTLRQIERIVQGAPFDEAAQVDAAAGASATVRALLAR